ncbi:fructose-bisphosphate aldolase [Methanocella sp. CWC-04]|uniref:2-amino-3,7-dideoxy-D-threo-hept-6-ulosonate synthase n=1 Tax=Methanooceanicella nereidis TaxID=2052831 RepID=A0AAP2RE56_9EURY|nr:2-amino-3,7-dideoxy-D-threo-hept-6-ulosonate synthase [Methanocella sp. CWC-04]MCD1295131.1 fructose-bisphosphate aldolase [Methanocella sp. CWC-04]
MDGKTVRMNRILRSGKAVIVPMDHGVSEGPIAGIIDMNRAVSLVERGGASAVLVHKGIIRSLKTPPSCGMIMHISAGTKYAEDKNKKVIVSCVDQAVRLGADALSVHVNIGGSASEPDMMEELGKIADDCDATGMPLLVMAYARGKNVTSSPLEIAHAARVAGELGADIVKCPYTGDIKSMKLVVDSCPVPVVIAGGPKCEDDIDVLRMVDDAMTAGAIGISLGRNIFQHETPDLMTAALRSLIVDGVSVEDASEILKENLIGPVLSMHRAEIEALR